MKKLIVASALVLALGLLPAPAHASNWTYAAQIFSVSHTGAGASQQTAGGSWIKTGDTVEVTATGTPGAKMTFDVGENAQGNPMTEVSPGKYVGKFTLEVRHFIHEQVWIVVHSSQDGESRTLTDSTPLVLAP